MDWGLTALFGKKTVLLVWMTWDELKDQFAQPAMVLERINVGDTSLTVDAPLVTGFGTFADPPNPPTPYWLAVFSELCAFGPPIELHIDFARGEGMRLEQLTQRLEQLRGDGVAHQESGSSWSAKWHECAGPLEMLKWVHGCGFDYMWHFGDLIVTDSDGASLLVLGSRSDLDTVAGVFTRLTAEHNYRVEALSTI